jgi:beta-aspartyl-peptidase (threonine type)
LNQPVIIVHGGAKEIDPEKVEPSKAGCRRAADAGWAVLERGGSALDAIEAAVRALEEDGTFNAGYGATLNPDGVARLDAGMMDGATLNAGAVAAVETVRHPCTVARRVLEAPEVLIVGQHADRWARENVSQEQCSPGDLISPEQRSTWQEKQKAGAFGPGTHDTVGAVALDKNGHLAACASTGGTGDKYPGRVGDSPIAGSGFYADDGLGACALTGEGEGVLRLTLGRVVLDQVSSGRDPDGAILEALDQLQARTEARAGIILLTPDGRIGWGHNERDMAVAYRTTLMDGPAAFTNKMEEK